MRVVSLLPSATELLCEIGGEHLLVGRSHECDYPTTIRHLPILTRQRTSATTSAQIDEQVRQAMADKSVDSLYTLDTDLLQSLKPDVILTQDLCDVCSIDLNTVRAIANLIDSQPTIISLNPTTVEDVFKDLLRIGEAVGMVERARTAITKLEQRYDAAVAIVRFNKKPPEVAFLEWMDPLFVGGHWTPQLIEAAGGRHSLNPPGCRSRQIEPAELVACAPERLIICPCGYDLSAIKRELDVLTSQPWWTDLPAVRDHQVVLVDGSAMFNRPGPRLVDALSWLVGWLNDRPELIPPDFPVAGLPAPNTPSPARWT